ncbi:MAG: hypothetical protein IPP74_14990 [Alphaproteobacteria bacterium]|nr:hypothetical protein [Alphaproteobacteria bacterium]
MLYMKPKQSFIKQQTPKHLQMQSQAARMASEGKDVAPVVPTTNMQVRAPQATAQQAQGPRPATASTGLTSGAPPSTAAPGMSSGQGMPNVTGRTPPAGQFNMQLSEPDSDGSAVAANGPPRLINQSVNDKFTDILTDKPGPGSFVGDPRDDSQTPMSNEELYQQAISKLLGEGPRNTTEDEKLIRDQMLRDVGAGQADLNARMGASGFGTSGALGALSGDMRSRAALDAQKAISGVRTDARQEYLDRLGMGLKGSNDAANLAIKQAAWTAYQQMLDGMQGGDAPTPDNTTIGATDVSHVRDAPEMSQADYAQNAASWGSPVYSAGGYNYYENPADKSQVIKVKVQTMRD